MTLAGRWCSRAGGEGVASADWLSDDGTYDPTHEAAQQRAARRSICPRGMEVGEYRVAAQDRRGRHGRGLRGRAPGDRQARRDQGAGRAASPRTPSWSRASSPRRARSTRSATRTSSTSSRSASCPTGGRYFVDGVPRGRAARRDLHASAAPLALDEALALLARRSRDALDAAHARGHRPPRPQARQHLRRRRERGDRSSKLLDFGIAKLLGDGRRRTTRRGPASVHRHAALHVARAVPRQGRRSPRADIYALGVILYQMLTGAAAVPGRDVRRDPRQAASVDTPAPPSSHAPIAPAR